jgi:hypothetical protein
MKAKTTIVMIFFLKKSFFNIFATIMLRSLRSRRYRQTFILALLHFVSVLKRSGSNEPPDKHPKEGAKSDSPNGIAVRCP